MSDGPPAQDVLRVLKAHKVFVHEVDSGTGEYDIIRGEFLETHVLRGHICKKLTQYFARKLDIPIHHFWHPEAAEEEDGKPDSDPCE
jgi:hypothetical protein